MTEAQIVACFKKFDENGDGKISHDQLKSVFRLLDAKIVEITDTQFQDLFDEVDSDGNGQIDYAEFLAWVMKGSSDAKMIISAGSSSIGKAEEAPIATPGMDPIIEAAALAVKALPLRDHYGKHFLENECKWWERGSGYILEPMLQVDAELGDSPVRLVDARFLIELESRGGKLCRRQGLPDSAFISLEALKRLGHGTDMDRLRIAAVSHPWQQPDHPDPYGLNLKLLAQFLRILLQSIGGTIAIFFDFASLYQKGPNGEERSEKEAALFKKALKNMMDWYAHLKVMTLKLTELPEGYPEGFKFAPGTTPNIAGYHERGWCFCESSVSNMGKDNDMVYDLGQLSLFNNDSGYDLTVASDCECWLSEFAISVRSPPLAPDEFRLKLSEKSFTSKKADEEVVADLYEKTCTEWTRNARHMYYACLGWGNDEISRLSTMMASMTYESCQDCILTRNDFGDEGMRCLSDALGKGALPNCQQISLSYNKIGDKGVCCLADALGKGALSNCQSLDLCANDFGDEGVCCLADALGKGALPNCLALHLCQNESGDQGVVCLADALGKGALPNLTQLGLEDTKISDEGRHFLHESLAQAGRSELEVAVGSNPWR